MICPHCKKETVLKYHYPEMYRANRLENARATYEKKKENGTLGSGGRHKIRDDLKIKRLRLKGLSIRQIAKLTGVSSSTVWKVLK